MHLIHLTYHTSELNLADFKYAQNTTSRNTGNTMHCKVWAVHLGMAQYRCSQSHESVVLHTVSPGKEPNSKFKVQFLFNVYSFAPLQTQKIVNQNIVSQGLFVFLKSSRSEIERGQC